MECAIVLGKRGYERVIWSTAELLRGYAALAASLPHLGEWRRLIDWRVVQLNKLRNVEVLTEVNLDAEAARTYGAEVIIVAAGAEWVSDGTNHSTHGPIPGAGLPHVRRPEEVVRAPGGGPRQVWLRLRGLLHGRGAGGAARLGRGKVTVVTPLPVVAPFLDRTFEGTPVRQQLARLGVRWFVDTELAEITSAHCRLRQVGPRLRN